MPIQVTRSGASYRIRLAPPESKVGTVSRTGLSRDQAVRAMGEAGVHVQDMWDALLEADAAAEQSRGHRRTRAAAA